MLLKLINNSDNIPYAKRKGIFDAYISALGKYHIPNDNKRVISVSNDMSSVISTAIAKYEQQKKKADDSEDAFWKKLYQLMSTSNKSSKNKETKSIMMDGMAYLSTHGRKWTAINVRTVYNNINLKLLDN